MCKTPEWYLPSSLLALGGGLTGRVSAHERACSFTGLFVQLLPGPGRWAHRMGHCNELPGTALDTPPSARPYSIQAETTHTVHMRSVTIFVGGTATGRPASITALCAAAKPSGA